MSEPLDVDAIAARAEAATPGPWVDGVMPEWSPSDLVSATATRTLRDSDGSVWVSPIQILDAPNPTPYPADREFIAHARTDIPALLAAYTEVVSQRDAARSAALDDFLRAVELALETYKSEGALLALTLGNKNFGGDSAVELIARGEQERVFDWLRSLTGMVAT